MANGDTRRQIAYKVGISDLLKGKYIQEEGWKPNYILSDEKKISRVNLVGTVISVSFFEGLNYYDILIDDGSGNIVVRSFDPRPEIKNLLIGDTINVIGRPREYGTQKYITYEIIRKIDNIKWVEIRKMELELEKLKKGKNISSEEVVEKVTGSALTAEKIYYLIKNSDTGEGVNVETLLQKLNTSDTGACDQILKSLLEQGEIFEVKPGRYKVLE